MDAVRAPTATGEQDRPVARVLVVDDSAVGLKLMRLVIEREGHRVTEAAGPEEALDAFARERPDLVLVDIQLPGMDGVELAQRLRQGCAAAGHRPPPFVAMTAESMPGDRERFLAAGFDEYLPKPVDLHRLRGLIDGLAARDARREGV